MSLPAEDRSAWPADASRSLRDWVAAARRAPLADDRRCPAAAPIPQTLLEARVGRRMVWIHGLSRRQAIALFKRAGATRYMYDGRDWCVPLVDADHVLTVAEHALRFRVVTTAVDR
jgi:hypothetical protein